MKKTWRARMLAEQARQIQLFLQDRRGSLVAFDTQLGRDDSGQRGLA